MNRYLTITALLITLFLLTTMLPNHADRLALSREGITQGQYWRIFTYQFVHLDWTHLLINTLTLLIAATLASELATSWTRFSGTYLASGVLAVLPLWAILNFSAAGASTAIYSVLGLLAFEAKKYDLHPTTLITILILLSLVPPLKDLATCAGICEQARFSLIQTGSHLSGLAFGILTHISLTQLTKNQARKKLQLMRGITEVDT